MAETHTAGDTHSPPGKSSAQASPPGEVETEGGSDKEPEPGAAFPVVGIGASAGGLEAFKNFFQAMPPDSGIAFVLVQHLDPTHESMMVDLLAKYTAMRVVQVEDRMPVAPNTVFMIPPNRYMSIKDGELHLSEPTLRRGMRMPIDYFFRSLAEDQKERAICIILSGTGADGTLGLRAVKGEGGTALVQDPKTCQYDGMPASAVATGLVDFVLPVEEIPKALTSYVQHAYVWQAGEGRAPAETKPDEVQSILAVLQTRGNHDFRCYKKGTVTRRIQRRMGLRQAANYGDYLKLLREDANEVKLLSRDLLIGVTAFFRDPDAWKELEEQVLMKLVARKGAGDRLRIWVPGCSSGEEAYSLGMLVTEVQGRLNNGCTVQIFASDIDEAALEVARNGVYPESIAADVSPERLRRFFINEEGRYRVGKQLRESVVFAAQNLISDPPFSKLDLVSCRNLLIYLDTTIQRRVVSLFHFSLNEGGYLFLGPSESIGTETDLFEGVSKKWRIFRRIGIDQRGRVEFPIVASEADRQALEARGLPRQPRPGSVTALAHDVLLREYAPACVIVNRKGEALYYQGPVSDYLQVVPGEPTRDVAEQAREGLRLKLRSALQQAIRENEKITVTCRLRDKEDGGEIQISVRPLNMPRSVEGLLLVTFQDLKEPATTPEPPTVEHVPEEVRQLEHELIATREDLQSTIEELETSNEELKASNEEVMSMNEELQSTNEELETSKEELQSLNEELNTVNNQLQDKVLDLESANNDMANLLNSTDIATLFLDRQLQVRRFTPSATRLFRLIPTDIGRHLEDIALRFRNGDLLAQARQVLDKLQPCEKVVTAEDGGLFLCRILPYRTMDDRIDGVVLTFVDVTALRRAESKAQLLAAALHAADNSVFIASRDGAIEWTNAAFTRQTGYTEAEALGKNPRLLDSKKQPKEFWGAMWKTILAGGVWRGEFVNKRKDGSFYDTEMTISPVCDSGGDVERFIAILQDVSERKRMERALRRSERLYRAIGESIDFGIWICDPDGRNTYASDSFLRLVGLTQQQCSDFGWGEVLHPDDAERTLSAWKECVRTAGKWDIEHRFRGVDGQWHHVLARGVPVKDEQGQVWCWAGINLDISALKAAQEALAQSRNELEQAVSERTAELQEAVSELMHFSYTMTHDMRAPLRAIGGYMELLESEKIQLSKEGQRHLSRVAAASRRMDRLIIDALDYAKLSERSFEITPVDVGALLKGMLESYPHFQPPAVRISVADHMPLALANEAGLTQCFSNLLNNAIKFVQPGKTPEIRVRAQERGEWVRFCVEDNGIGIPTHYKEKIFGMFHRLNQGFEGTGIGLALVRKAVQRMGGSVGVESEPGNGSRFWLEFKKAV